MVSVPSFLAFALSSFPAGIYIPGGECERGNLSYLPLLFAPWQRYGHDRAASIFLPWKPQHCLPCGFLFLEVTSCDSGWGKYGNLVRIRHCFPGPGRKIELCLAAHSGRLAPPRFSRSCPHCLRLWLDRGTIVGRQGHGETACHGCFWLGVVRSLPGRGFPFPAGLGASSSSLSWFAACLLMLFNHRI